ncbi:MAG: peptidylprolyl isomerase [Bacteroidota bacterium]
MNRHWLFLLSIVLLGLYQCMPVKEEKITEVNFSLKDPLLQKILGFQDRRQTDSLLVYFQHKDPTYRYAAAMAFASYKEEKALDSLMVLLEDEVSEVKQAAAYAIGQIGSERSSDPLVKAFADQDTSSVDLSFSRVVLEAVGKSASDRYLDALSTISTYNRSDTLLLEGQALGLYRYALRGKTNPEGTSRMVDMVSKKGYPESVQFIAANYLSRARNIQLDSFARPLVKAFERAEDARTRMALALALGKSKQIECLTALLKQFATEQDYRVQCNIIRALGNFDYASVNPVIATVLNDANPHVSAVAAQYYIDHGVSNEGVLYYRRSRDTSLNWSTQVKLLEAAMKHVPPFMEMTVGNINFQLRRRFEQSTNTQEQSAALKAMAGFPWNYRYIKEKGFAADVPLIRTASVEALSAIASRPDFNQFFGLSRRRAKKELAQAFEEAIRRGDVGMSAVAAGVLRNDQLDFATVLDSTSFLQEALTDLQLPRDIETYNEIVKTIAFFEGDETPNLQKTEYNHPIDWKVVSTVTDKTRARIQTNKGDVRLRFFPEQAPGSVANFVMLSRAGFYDKKTFHRVVPNFVIQGGCPRGDGYGSLDYNIRSELPVMNYDKAGYVGMASAGLDTECSQWFITHAPTPHLDGRYTIFAQVTEGMDIVHTITQGDVIERIVIE